MRKNNPKNIEDLMKVLQREKDPIAIKKAAEAIGETNDVRAVETLLRVLRYFDKKENKRKNAYVVKEVIEVLVKIGKPAVKPLVKILRGKHGGSICWYSSHLPFYATEALVRIGEPSVKPLIETMGGGPLRAHCSGFWFESVCEWNAIAKLITDTLIKIGEPSVKPLIQSLKRTKSGYTRIWACEWAGEVLVKIKDQRVMEYLIQALKDKDIQDDAKCILRRIGKKAVKPLIHSLQDKNSIIRSRSAVVIGCLDYKSTVKPLIQALKDTSPDVRHSAAWALGIIKDQRAVEALTWTYKNDSKRSVRQEAKWALEQIE